MGPVGGLGGSHPRRGAPHVCSAPSSRHRGSHHCHSNRRPGRRIGVRQIKEEGETASKGLSAIEGAIFGLLGLILAFLFSGSLTRFDAARHLVVEEANYIGTAWLRIALLPADAQPSMRDLFRRYLDSRIEVSAATERGSAS